MPLPIFPAHRFNPKVVKSGVYGRVIQSPPSISGIDQAVSTDGGGRWQVFYEGIILRRPEEFRLWEAWDGYLQGGVNECLVPLISGYTAPRPFAKTHVKPMGAIGDDDPYFPEAVEYRVPSVVATANSAAQRSTLLTIGVSKGSKIAGGEKFSMGERAHRIERVVSRSGMTATVRVNPPARTAITNGTPVNFDWPMVRCRLIRDQDLSVEINQANYDEKSIAFVESF